MDKELSLSFYYELYLETVPRTLPMRFCNQACEDSVFCVIYPLPAKITSGSVVNNCKFAMLENFESPIIGKGLSLSWVSGMTTSGFF